MWPNCICTEHPVLQASMSDMNGSVPVQQPPSRVAGDGGEERTEDELSLALRLGSLVTIIIIVLLYFASPSPIQLYNVCIVIRLSQEQEAQRQERVRAEEEEILRQVLELSLKEK